MIFAWLSSWVSTSVQRSCANLWLRVEDETIVCFVPISIESGSMDDRRERLQKWPTACTKETRTTRRILRSGAQWCRVRREMWKWEVFGPISMKLWLQEYIVKEKKKKFKWRSDGGLWKSPPHCWRRLLLGTGARIQSLISIDFREYFATYCRHSSTELHAAHCTQWEFDQCEGKRHSVKNLRVPLG